MEQNLEILVRAVIASYVKRNRRTLTRNLLRTWLEHRTGENTLDQARYMAFMESTKSFEVDTKGWDDVVGPFVVDLIVELRKNLEKEFSAAT
jgi:hypothetical protein